MVCLSPRIVILPVAATLDGINLILDVVQLNDFRFFSGNSSFFGRFGLLHNKFRRITLHSAPCEVHGSARTAMGCWKGQTCEGRHERLLEEKGHVRGRVWKTWKKWRRRNVATMRTEF